MKKMVSLQKILMQSHLHFDCLDSTSACLKRLIEASLDPMPEDFYTITADKQENGRGRQHKIWESEGGKNLLMSVLLRTPCAPQQQFHICRYVSLSLVAFLTEQLNMENAYIKWPNDIYVEDKKIAGILIEHFLQGNTINYSIAGIGLNVNQTVFPKNLPNPTSILLETNKETAPLFCMEEIVKNMKKLSASPSDLLKRKYEQFLYKKDKYASFLIPQKSDYPIVAKIKGVTEKGLLYLLDENDSPYCCSLNEITYL